jgi:hypothetical protein
MQPFRLTEEKSNMKLRFAALLAGFCLVVGLPLAAIAGPTPGGASGADGDTIEDSFDNCTGVANADQKDVDHDGCGDRCDGDFDQNGGAGISDFTLFKGAFNTIEGQPAYNAAADMDCNGGVGTTDFSLFKAEFNTPTGPSGVSAKNPTACP